MHNNHLKWIITFVTVIGNFISVLDSSTVNIALYDISQTLHEPMTSVQWVVIGYMLVLTIFLPFFGKLSDFYAKNKLYATGFLIFSLGSLLSFLSPTLPILIICRCIQALGGSILISNSFSIIGTLFKGRKRGKALGLNGAVVAFASMSGPALSGVLINYFGWNTIFLPGCLIGLIFAMISYKLIPSYTPPREKEKFDYKGFLYYSIFLFSILITISQGHIWGWCSKKIAVLTLVFLVSTIMFGIRELRVPYALIDFSLFKHRTFAFGNIAINLSYWGVSGIGVLFPLFAQRAMGFSPMLTGFIVLTYAASLIFTAPISGSIAGKKGCRWLTFAGGVVYTIALLIFSRFDVNTPVFVLVLTHMMLGVANGLFQSPSNMGVLSEIESKNLGSAGGILALARNTGIIIGIATAINILEIFEHLFSAKKGAEAFLYAYQHTALILAGFAVVCTLFAYIAYKNENKQAI